MGGKSDEIKGRIKEAAGALTGNDKLRDEGKTDQAVGKVKQAVQKVVDAVEDTVDKVLEHLMTRGLKVAEGDRFDLRAAQVDANSHVPLSNATMWFSSRLRATPPTQLASSFRPQHRSKQASPPILV